MLINDEDRVSSWVTERTGDGFTKGIHAAIGAVKDDELIAGVVYDHYTESCITATIAVDKKMLPRNFLRIIFRYPFDILGVSKIIVYINEANKASVKLATKLGFSVEARIKDVYPDGGMLILGMSKANCVWTGV